MILNPHTGKCDMYSDTNHITFSICPGRFLANSTIWAAMASLLAVFELDKAKNSMGEDIDIKAAFTDGFVRCVLISIPYSDLYQYRRLPSSW